MKLIQANVNEIILLATELAAGGIVDDRPDWLRAMPSASDNTALYYPFLYQLMRRLPAKPPMHQLLVLEIGTYLATSAAHMAYGAQLSEGAQIVTVDIDENAVCHADAIAVEHGLPLLAYRHDASARDAQKALVHGAPYDILFIDANHDFISAYGQYAVLRSLVRDGGLIFFDDIELNPEMRAAWEFIPEKKYTLNALHYTGFGVVVKDSTIPVPAWDDVIDVGLARASQIANERLR